MYSRRSVRKTQDMSKYMHTVIIHIQCKLSKRDIAVFPSDDTSFNEKHDIEKLSHQSCIFMLSVWLVIFE